MNRLLLATCILLLLLIVYFLDAKLRVRTRGEIRRLQKNLAITPF